jgi:L-2-hydroxyglutarate oxidase LhgO
VKSTPASSSSAPAAALPLLQLSGIPESKGFGGFPVSGQWLRCDNPEIVKQHQAKVYSQAAVGAPPMSVPHLDTRVVDGKKSLLFGPMPASPPSSSSTVLLMDLPLSVRMGNIGPMLAVARDNMDLTKYLVSEVMQSMEQRLEALRASTRRPSRRLAPGSGWPARADHQERPEERRRAAVRHRTGLGPGRQPGRTARRFAGRFGDRVDHARN